MKTTEIMIGDWFWYGGIGFKVAEIKGREIVSELMVDTQTRMGMDIKTTADKLHHIRLTRELLEKNGWEEYNRTERFYNEDAQVLVLVKSVDSENLWWWYSGQNPLIPINYVHQLQHALRLCGIKKEIVL